MKDRGAQLKGLTINRPIVLIGLMGAGKSRIGKDLATKYGFSFADTDVEIVKAAGCSISDIFELYGEQAFRDLEERVMSRLLSHNVQIIAAGGGTFMNARNRKIIGKYGISIWLKAELGVLIERTSRRKGRPLLERGEPTVILKELMNERYPIYSKADIVINTEDNTIDETVNATAEAIAAFFDKKPEIKKQ